VRPWVQPPVPSKKQKRNVGADVVVMEKSDGPLSAKIQTCISMSIAGYNSQKLETCVHQHMNG
jgi:hypothetical protein